MEVSFNGGEDFTSDGHRFMYEKQAVVESLTPTVGRSDEAGMVVTRPWRQSCHRVVSQGLTRIVQYPVLCCRPDGRQFY